MAATSGSRGVVLNSPDMASDVRASSPRSRLSSPIVAAGAGSSRSSPVPASPGAAKVTGLLIPTDRTIDELEEIWLPKLGNLRVEREVVLPGYALYGVRSWYLSRTHWSHTIVTATGKPTETITAYVLQPDGSFSDKAGERQLAQAIAYLTAENKSSVRKTEYGTLLVNTPSGFGQDVTAIPGGDYRRAKPFIVVNTAIRRLGCGGRAAMALEPPSLALRRKLSELYKLPVPTAPSSTITSQPPQSPVSPTRQRWGGSPVRGEAPSDPAALSQATDPFTIITMELVRLIQAALALWGVYGADREDPVFDGLFCDDTKAGISAWRRAMSMEHEDSLKLEKETHGGCINPRTLSALLSSVTSSRYHLAILYGEKVPKDPFSHIKGFLQAWHTYQVELGRYSGRAEYLSVASIRALITDFKAERKRSGADALKVPRLFLSGVASATSSISANLRGGGTEDTPLRMREHHHAHFRDDVPDEESGSGMGLITPDDQVGHSAAPNIITTDLEAYISGILHSRQKDWDAMGARRIAELWSGRVGTDGQNPRRGGSRQVSRSGTLVKPNHKARVASRDFAKEDEGEDSAGVGGHGGVRSALKGMADKTEQVLSRGLGMVTGTNYETSDSEPGPGPSTLRNSASARGRMSVPTVMEPDVMEEEYVQRARFSASPSPSGHTQREANGSVRTRPSFLATSRQGSDVRSKRPSIITNLSYDGSDTMSRRSRQSSMLDVSALATQSLASGAVMGRSSRINGRRSPLEERWEADRAEHSGTEQSVKLMVPRTAPERALAWRERGRATTMLRTASDGADVVVEERGMEWEVVEPHGTGRRPAHGHGDNGGMFAKPGRMRRSQSDTALHTHSFRPIDPEYLQIDIELCTAVWELRERMALLTQRANDLKMLESSIFRASAQLIDAHKARRGEVAAITEASTALIEQIEHYVDDIENDQQLEYLRGKIIYNGVEAGDSHSLQHSLGLLQVEWAKVRTANEQRRRETELDEEPKSWWKLW